MEPQKNDRVSLQQRVSQILSNPQPQSTEKTTDDEAMQHLFEMLQKAKADLQASQQRVDRLKWQLAKAQTASSV